MGAYSRACAASSQERGRCKGVGLAVTARVLIVARDDRYAGPLALGLDRLGWRSVTARGEQGALAAAGDLPIEACIVDLSGGDPELHALPARLKSAALPRRLPVVGIGASEDDPALDLAVPQSLEPAQAAARLEALVRSAVAEEELALRRETFAERGAPLRERATDTGPLLVLTVGEPAPRFLALSNALGEAGAEVVAALTPYTAFDYLHERDFHAVVLWSGDRPAEALSIASGIRRNTRLYHTPTVLIGEGGEPTAGEAFSRGVSDLVAVEAGAAEAARRTLSLARLYRRELAIRATLEAGRGSGLMDAATGLFTRELFAAHLARMSEAARVRRRRLSVAVLKIAERPAAALARREGSLDRAMPQIGSMMGRLVRVEDTAARLGPEVFALALPAAGLAEARAAAERIAAVLACTAFESRSGSAPFTLDFEIGAAELEPGEAAARTLERAAAKVLSRAAG